jgi:hypothetical protein
VLSRASRDRVGVMNKSLYSGLCGAAAAHGSCEGLQHTHGLCEGLAVRIG